MRGKNRFNYRVLFTLWRTVHCCTLSHVSPTCDTDQRMHRPPLFSAFPDHERMTIKGWPESRRGQFARNGEPGNSGASYWTDDKEMPLLMGTPTGGYLQYRPTSIPGGTGPSVSEWALPWSALGVSAHLASGALTRCCLGFTRMWG